MANKVWHCLACGKFHPPDPGAVEFACADCGLVGLGHSDGFALCEDCQHERLANLDEEDDVDDELASWPLVS